MACAFYASARADYYEVIEFLLHRYGSLAFIYGMTFTDFLGFYKVAKEKHEREQNYAAWVSCLPYMNKENFISFEDYNARMTGENIDKRPAEEILAEVEEIRRKAKENGNINL